MTMRNLAIFFWFEVFVAMTVKSLWDIDSKDMKEKRRFSSRHTYISFQNINFQSETK